MHIYLSLSAGTNLAKKRMPRVGKKAFMKFSGREQQSYLKEYPHSSHRLLLSKETTTKPLTQKPDTVRRISREDYDALPRREQRKYDKAFKDRDPDRKFIGRKHAALKARSFAHRRPVHNKLAVLSEKETVLADQLREKLSTEFKAAITPESTAAVERVTGKDLAVASSNLANNKVNILAAIERHLDDERIAQVLIDDEVKNKLRHKVAADPYSDDAEVIQDQLDKNTRTKDDVRTVESFLGKLVPDVVKKDIAALKSFAKGDSNIKLLTAMSIVGRYMLLAGGVAAIAAGGAPLALYIGKEIYDSFSNAKRYATAADSDEDVLEDFYDMFTDHLQNLDLEAVKTASRRFKFEAVAASTRISYRSDSNELEKPLRIRSNWTVIRNQAPIGYIWTDKEGDNINPETRQWSAYVTDGFNPMEFPHVEEEEGLKEPYVLTNGEGMRLYAPSLMSLVEARRWVCGIIERGDENAN